MALSSGGSMAQDFWKDKHLNDQYNKRNPGQENHPDSQREKKSPPSPTPAVPEKERQPEKKK
jgi:hypothetical protein